MAMEFGRVVFNLVIAAIMVGTGTINTLAAKWSDVLYSPGTNPRAPHIFIHPYLQASMMFLGEMSCYVVFKIQYIYYAFWKKDISIFGPQKFNPLIWAVPAMCDLTATSTMYVGLTWTYASSFQMLRGSVIIFTGLLSVAFLGTRLKIHQWLGMFTVVIGLVLVGIGDVVFFQSTQHMERNTVLAGDLLIVFAQGIVAIQMTFEEKVIKKYEVPALQGVGWEGIFGFSVLTVLLFPMFFVPWHLPATQDFWQITTRFEDSVDGLYQIFQAPLLLIATLGMIVSIAFFNFSGLTVTKTMSATTRMVLDSVRTIFIWVVSLILQWQKFEPLQPVGYGILFVGTCIYYDLIFMPAFRLIRAKLFYKYQRDHSVQDRNPEKRPLLSPSPIEKDSSPPPTKYAINSD